jgi:hypothetical protein
MTWRFSNLKFRKVVNSSDIKSPRAGAPLAGGPWRFHRAGGRAAGGPRPGSAQISQ